MATTIKLKNGTGAPSAGALVVAEPALDLTNKRLYTEDSGGTVIEVGTNPSTINIDAGTIDGTVIGGTTTAAGSFTTLQADTSLNVDGTVTADSATIDGAVTVNGAGINLDDAYSLTWGDGSAQVRGSGSSEAIDLRTANTTRLNIDADGDVSLYNSAGTSQDLFWDASESRLGLGTTTPDQLLHMSASTPIINMEHIGNSSSRIYFESSTDGNWGAIRASNASGARSIELTPNNGLGDSRFGGLSLGQNEATIGGVFDTDYGLNVYGNVGIGTTTPSEKLTLNNGSFRLSDGYAVGWGDNTTRIAANSASDFFQFITNNSEAMRLDSSGHLIVPNGVTLGTAVGTYAAANTLDDYEEGTWDPVWTPESGTIVTNTSFSGGSYTKIGNIVHVHARLYTNNVTSPAGEITISGLPFAVENNTENRGMQLFSLLGITGTLSGVPVIYFKENTSTAIVLDKVWDSTEISGDIANHFDNDTWGYFYGVYRTA